MKIKPEVRSQKPEAGNPVSVLRSLSSERGVALVITLILLSVTLVMAVAFLFISQREQGSVTTQTDAATARYASDAALANAEAQIAANMLASSPPNPYNFGLLVSTNYINPNGFVSGVSSYTNVNYYDTAGNIVGGSDFNQLLINLFYSPRLPVLISTNEPSGRYYLDLNRNGRYDTNGISGDFDASGNLISTSFHTGDPEWIGVLERPDVPYGPNNKAVARFAFIAMPIGNSLDLNAIHNQAMSPSAKTKGPAPINPPLIGSQDTYFRNQGVGSWEVNLAAFLSDLNTNEWGQSIGAPSAFYQYNQPAFDNSGIAFDDARAFLAFRYHNDYHMQTQVVNLFGANGATVFQNDNIDGYSDGPLQNSFQLPIEDDNANHFWVGSDNTNHFFSLPTDLFDTTKVETGVTTPPGFIERLQQAGTNNSTYDRYTFYRLLSQLGTDSEPESGKMNLNYDNLDPGTNGVVSETNFMAWTPLGFFTNAADRMLRDYTARWAYTNFGAPVNINFVATFNVTNVFGVANIPVWVSNKFVYTPSVQRILQLAANIYDATTTNFYPSVFRPVFTNDNGNVFIAGYAEMTNSHFQESLEASAPELSTPIELRDLPLGQVLTNVYGVPWIIGAKKGFPNFNEFSMQSAFQLTRKLEVTRAVDNSKPYPAFTAVTGTNQMFLMNITNYYGIECWNSYRSNYSGAVEIFTRCSSIMTLTNDNNFYPLSGGFTNGFNFTNILYFPATTVANHWVGWNGVIGNPQNPSSFAIPLNTNVTFFSNTVAYFYNEPNPPNSASVFYAGSNPTNFYDKGIREFPHFGLLTTNRLQVVIIDYSAGLKNGRIIDYVQLGGLDSSRDLNSEIQDPLNNRYHFWDTNLYGITEQIKVSKSGTNWEGVGLIGADGWTTATIPGGPVSGAGSAQAQEAFFTGFFAVSGKYAYNGKTYTNTLLAMQAPYTPIITAVQHSSWEVNDPLVHYIASDLAPTDIKDATFDWPPSGADLVQDLGSVNQRYMPWGRGFPVNNRDDSNPYNLAFKDPLVGQSDNWDFPTNKFPTAGWLGRVHRGTPWQTVYLKAMNILDYAVPNSVNGYLTWSDWTGNGNSFDATNTAPIEDRLLFDSFTTAFNDNATRGQLSINVGSASGSHDLAAWSAVFSGIAVPPNNATNSYTTIDPAGVASVNSALGGLVTNINYTRAIFTNRDGLVGVFEHKGDILATPKFTEQSPFLDLTQTNYNNDEMYEWLPQQVMSLLRVSGSPRYVIYSYGQSLKPAGPSALVTSGTLFGMITNYQVTAESATRAVVRIEGAPTNTHAVIESFNILPSD
ncbi:MAG TPA: pilus assembly PilX N-terminal domain-containing protein [Methylomirabilota bacterium]|nr:pilus assembly PilX N-terminal domain-containing protein [Methylomirabilota bacterium]